MNNADIENALKDMASETNVPPWAKVIINCLRNLVLQKDIGDDLTQRVKAIEESMATKQDIKDLQKENRLLRIQIAGLKDELDAAEQYSRRNCLVFHGIPEKQGESTSQQVMGIIRDSLNVPAGKVDTVSVISIGPIDSGNSKKNFQPGRTNVFVLSS